MDAATTCQQLGITNASVLGAGTMGAGIAQVLAQVGIKCCLFDINQDAIDGGLERIGKMLAKGVERGKVSQAEMDATMGNLCSSTEVANAVKGCDLVIEAAPERMDLKQQLFAEVAANVGSDCIVATNTSSLSISELGRSVPNPERFLGLHFFNPPPLMKLLEIVRGEQTDNSVVEKCRRLAELWGKSPIVVKDAPGFASSRLGLVIGLEAMRMVDEEIASPEDIDTAMKLGYGFPMGPLELTDLIGLDVRLDIANYLADTLSDVRFAAPEGLRQRVAEGKLGKKTGEGYHSWTLTPFAGSPSPKKGK